MEKVSEKHRTTIAHFLNHEKWDENVLEQCVKREVVRRICEEAEYTGKPIYCIVDDTILSKTNLSSRALHRIEDSYFHRSHLKKKQDHGAVKKVPRQSKGAVKNSQKPAEVALLGAASAGCEYKGRKRAHQNKPGLKTG